MRIVTNEKLAKRNRQIASYLFFLTFLLLIGGFFIINASVFTQEQEPDPVILILQSLVLPAAFILTLFSIRMTNNWVRQPYPEAAIAENLKGLSPKSVLYNYYHLPTRHILICPQGVFALVTRWHDGKYSVNGREWRTHKSALSRFLSALRFDGIGNPTDDAERAAAKTKQLFASIAPDLEIQPVIVFISPRAQIDLTDPAVPVVFADNKIKPNLKDYLRDLSRENTPEEAPSKKKMPPKVIMPLSEEQIKAFEAQTLPE